MRQKASSVRKDLELLTLPLNRNEEICLLYLFLKHEGDQNVATFTDQVKPLYAALPAEISLD